MPQAPFVPVIPAGGSGTRLWPLSRRAHPKFLLDLTGSGLSLLQATVRRLRPLADGPALVVTGAAHAAAVRTQLEEEAALGGIAGEGAGACDQMAARVVAEPTPRNSMPAIALAAALIEREQPDAVIGSFAADHLIEDEAAFARAVASARKVAELGYLVTLGIEPTSPATGFGYIEQGEERARGCREGQDASSELGEALGGIPELLALGARPVARFVEKPDRERAEAFLATGRFLWNAGIFVVRASVLLDELAARIPALAEGAREIAAAHGTAQYEQVLERTWPRLTSIAIDHALAEPLAAEGRVAVVPTACGWDDVGDFAALAHQLRDRIGAPVGVRADPPADSPADSSADDPADDPADSPAGERPAGLTAAQAAGRDDVRVVGSASVDAVSSRATVYGSSNRHIALVGLDGISIVDTEDALLVLADDQAQDLAALVDRLDERGLGHLR